MDLGGEGVETIALFVYLKLHDSLLTWVHLYRELIGLLLAEDIDELPLLKGHSLAEVIVVGGFVGVVIVDIAGYWPCRSFDLAVLGVFIDALFLCELLVEKDYFVEERVYVELLSVL